MRLRIFLSVLTGVGVMNKMAFSAAYQIFSLSTSYLSPHFRWYFEGRKCEEPGQPWRLLSLHTAARQGQFCCRSGQCIRSVKRQFSSKNESRLWGPLRAQPSLLEVKWTFTVFFIFSSSSLIVSLSGLVWDAITPLTVWTRVTKRTANWSWSQLTITKTRWIIQIWSEMIIDNNYSHHLRHLSIDLKRKMTLITTKKKTQRFRSRFNWQIFLIYVKCPMKLHSSSKLSWSGKTKDFSFST